MKKQTAGLFLLGAGGYSLLEIAWRGYTHWTMALTGGAVLVGLHQLRGHVRDEKPFARCLCGAACITAAEYVVGCTVNRTYHMDVWIILTRRAMCTDRFARNTLHSGRCLPRPSCCLNNACKAGGAGV